MYILPYKCFAAESSVLLKQRPGEVLQCFVVAASSVFSLQNVLMKFSFVSLQQAHPRAERPDEVLQCFIQASVYSPWQNVLMKFSSVSLQQAVCSSEQNVLMKFSNVSFRHQCILPGRTS